MNYHGSMRNPELSNSTYRCIYSHRVCVTLYLNLDSYGCHLSVQGNAWIVLRAILRLQKDVLWMRKVTEL
jgi:hypothetical protein